MRFINIIFCSIPYLLGVSILFVILRLYSSKGKFDRVCFITLSMIMVMSIAMAIFYMPNKNILKNSNLTPIDILVDSKPIFEISDREKIDKIVEVINNQAFIRSAIKSVEQQNISDGEYFILSAVDTVKSRVVHLYLYGEHREESILQINEQFYNIRDAEGLTNDILGILKEFNIMN